MITISNIFFYFLNGISILTGIKWLSLIALVTQILNILCYLVLLIFFKIKNLSYTRIEFLMLFLYRGFVYLRLVAGWGLSETILFGTVGFFSFLGVIISGVGILFWFVAVALIESKKNDFFDF